MLRGERVVLRAVERGDVEALAAGDADPETWRLVDNGPYVPRTVADVLRDYDAGTGFRPDGGAVPFAVEAAGELVGRVVLHGIDRHNMSGQLGITLLPAARGKGYGPDAIRVLLRYAFRDRGLHRVQLEVLADNAPAIAAYRKVGFVEDGRRREAGWVDGRFVDEVVMSVLAPEWDASPG